MVAEQKALYRFMDCFAAALLFECTVKEPGRMFCQHLKPNGGKKQTNK